MATPSSAANVTAPGFGGGHRVATGDGQNDGDDGGKRPRETH
jgi:hypothetical protein